MFSENGCLVQKVQDGKSSDAKGVLNFLELWNLKIYRQQASPGESLIMNTGVAMKYGNDSAELSEVRGFYILIFHAAWILFSEQSYLLLGIRFGV